MESFLKSGNVTNAMCAITSEQEFRSLTIPKVAFSKTGRLLYMSRSGIPMTKAGEYKFSYKQVCIYAFSKEQLAFFYSSNSKTTHENIEDIEILRFIESDYTVDMVMVDSETMAVDTPGDLQNVIDYLEEEKETRNGPKGTLMTNYTTNVDEVIQGGYCVGCGACAVGNSQVEMQMTDRGQYIPIKEVGLDIANSNAVCPFASKKNEDDLAKIYFSSEIQNNYKPNVGYYDRTYAGYVSESSFREHGSSGGMVSWIGCQLIQKGEVDGIIHVTSSSNDGILFDYSISNTIEEVQSGSKSRYYPVKIDEVINQIKAATNKKYAIVGLPCVIKAVRLIMLNDKSVREKIKYCIGIVCGHLKSSHFSEILTWQQGIEIENVRTVDFRRKLKFRGASSYGFSSTTKTGNYKVTPMASLVGADWGQGLLKLQACEFCDDVFAETADIVIGDAWLQKYKKDSKGTNVIVSRNRTISNIIEEGRNENSLNLDVLDIESVFQSQSSGVKHRTEGLDYRLRVKRQLGLKAPMKRVKEYDFEISRDRVKIYEIRESLRLLSFVAYKSAKLNNNTKLFFDMLEPLVSQYKLIILGSKSRVKKSKIKNGINKYIRLITRTYNREIYRNRDC